MKDPNKKRSWFSTWVYGPDIHSKVIANMWSYILASVILGIMLVLGITNRDVVEQWTVDAYRWLAAPTSVTRLWLFALCAGLLAVSFLLCRSLYRDRSPEWKRRRAKKLADAAAAAREAEFDRDYAEFRAKYKKMWRHFEPLCRNIKGNLSVENNNITDFFAAQNIIRPVGSYGHTVLQERGEEFWRRLQDEKHAK